MRNVEPVGPVNALLRIFPAPEGQVAPAHRPGLAAAVIPGPARGTVRASPRPGSFASGEIALVTGLVAVALVVLPRPAALLLPVAYLIGRENPRHFFIAASALAALVPALITGERSDLYLGRITALSLAPLYLRLLTWRDRTGRWDVLDPLVIAVAPISFVSLMLLVARLVVVVTLFGESSARS